MFLLLPKRFSVTYPDSNPKWLKSREWRSLAQDRAQLRYQEAERNIASKFYPRQGSITEFTFVLLTKAEWASPPSFTSVCLELRRVYQLCRRNDVFHMFDGTLRLL